MRIKRFLKRFLFLGLALLWGCILLYWILRPGLMDRTEIFRGVFLTVDSIQKEADGSGRVMIVEVHWDTPGIRFANRSFDFELDPSNPESPHYRLAYADWALMRERASVLINTTIFLPDSRASIFPGMPVRSNETLVVQGSVSHIHEHSYLLYWDKEGDVHLEQSKPPSPESLEAAVTGIGLQGIPVFDGRARLNAIDHKDESFPRTFIGVDPRRKILFLMAFEEATAYAMIERAVEAGVVHGGMLDSGNSTNLLIGRGADGIHPHTGIRSWRPLGGYLTIHAKPL
jgi:hypothetical protein